MTESSHDAIDRTVVKTREWLGELAAEVGTKDRHKAYFPTDLRELFEISAQD